MGDYPDEQSVRELYMGGLEHAEASPESEKQRLLGLLLQPNTQYRIDQDLDYESDERLNSDSTEYTDFQVVLWDDWIDFVTQRAESNEDKVTLEIENLSPLPREQIEHILDSRIQAASSEEVKNELLGYKDRFLQRVDEYEQSLQSDLEVEDNTPGEGSVLSVPDNQSRGNGMATGHVDIRAGERDLVKNPEFYIGTNGVVSVEYLSDDYFNGSFQEGKKRLSFKLPKEAEFAAASNPEIKKQIQDVIVEVIQKNQGSPHPRFYSENGQLSLGIGKNKKRETLLQLNVDALRGTLSKNYPDIASKLSWYMEGKEKWLKKNISDDERETRREQLKELKQFERFQLGKVIIALGDGPERLQLSTHFWKKAFIESWKQKIGEEKYEELKQQAEALSAKTDAENGGLKSSEGRMLKPKAVIITHERAERTARKQGGQNFLKLINTAFGENYNEFLASGKFWDFQKQSGLLNPVEAMNLLADKILLQTGRTADYVEFQRFSRLPKHEQEEILKNNGMPYSINITSSLLGARLRMFLVSSEAVQAGRVGQKSGKEQLGGGNNADPEVESSGNRVETELSSQKTFDLISRQVKKQVEEQGVHPDDDPFIF